mgnify:CR=1 FL=1
MPCWGCCTAARTRALGTAPSAGAAAATTAASVLDGSAGRQLHCSACARLFSVGAFSATQAKAKAKKRRCMVCLRQSGSRDGACEDAQDARAVDGPWLSCAHADAAFIDCFSLDCDGW